MAADWKNSTSSPGLHPEKMGGAPDPVFKGKALGTRLRKTKQNLFKVLT